MLKTNIQLTDQKKGTLLAFIAIMFITPDSLLIRLSSIESWSLIFYRGIIPFFAVFIGLLIIQKGQIISALINNGWHGVAYVFTFSITNILFVISIENTNVANTLIMISLAPMLSAIISFIFLKEKLFSHRVYNSSTSMINRNEKITNVVKSLEELANELPNLFKRASSYFADLDRSLEGFELLAATQECLEVSQHRRR